MSSFPEMMELRISSDDEPQLLMLGADLMGDKVYAYGYITPKVGVPSGTILSWEEWQFKLGEDLPEARVALVPLHLDTPLRMEIVKWPTKS